MPSNIEFHPGKVCPCECVRVSSRVNERIGFHPQLTLIKSGRHSGVSCLREVARRGAERAQALQAESGQISKGRQESLNIEYYLSIYISVDRFPHI